MRKKSIFVAFVGCKFESKSANKVKCNKTCIMLYVNLSKNKPFRNIFEKIKKPFFLYINSWESHY